MKNLVNYLPVIIAFLFIQSSIRANVLSLADSTSKKKEKIIKPNNEEAEFEYDYKSKKLEKKGGANSLKKGDTYKITIKGLNQNLQKVSFSEAKPAEIKPITIPTFGSLDVSTITGALANVQKAVLSIQKVEEVISDQGSTDESIWSFDKNRNKVNNKGASTQPIKPKDFKPYIDFYKQGLSTLYSADSTLRTTNDFLIKLDECVLLKQQNLTSINYKITDNLCNTFNPNSLFTDISKHRKELIDLRNRILTQRQKHLNKKFEPEAFELIAQEGILKTLDTMYVSGISEVLKGVENALVLLNYTRIKENVDILDKLFTTNDSPITREFTYNGNATSYKIFINTIDKSRLNLDDDSLKISIPRYSKSYLLNGLGYYYSYLQDNIYTEVKTTTISSKDTTTSYRYDQEDGRGEMGLAYFVKYGIKCSDLIGLHGTFGAGFSIAPKVKPRLLLGGGISLGDKHMISLDGGIITGFVDRASKFIDTSKSYSSPNSNFTYNRIDLSYFISIGYLFNF